MTDVNAAWSAYDREARKLTSMERDIHSTPQQRREQAHRVLAAWQEFKVAFSQRDEPRAVLPVPQPGLMAKITSLLRRRA